MSFLRRLFGADKSNESEAIAVPEPITMEEELIVVEDEDTPTTDTGDDDTPTLVPPIQTRPLEPPAAYETTAAPSRHIRYGMVSDVGQVRSNNQDSAMALLTDARVTGNPPAVGLFIVADGMGGHKDGEHASAATVRVLSEIVVGEIVAPQLTMREITSDQKTIAEVLTEAMEAANLAVQADVPNGGTTATCAVIRGDLAYIAHVGDSRAYLVTEGNNMELITRDHSLVTRLKELGQLTDEEAEIHPQRNVLYRAIGQGDTLEVDAATRRLPPSSQLLICSDGLWGVIGDERIAEILADSNDPQEACNRMVDAANQSGGPDNITVVIVEMPA